jgi:hypothetical protein
LENSVREEGQRKNERGGSQGRRKRNHLQIIVWKRLGVNTVKAATGREAGRQGGREGGRR